MSNYVYDKAAAGSLSAYIILNKRGEYVAKVQFFHGATCLVNVFQSGKALERSEASAREADHSRKSFDLAFQYGRASGGGYGKATAALSGLFIDGHAMTDHCSRLGSPKPPKGCTLYPRDAKAKAGYQFSNYGTVRKSDGKNIRPYVWTDAALAELNLDSLANATEAERKIVSKRADEMAAAFNASDDREYGYSDCYRLPGLKYLEALGYSVIQAI